MPATKGGFGQDHGPKQCTAMSKRSKERCKGPAVAGDPNQKCRMHGGKPGPVGTDSPTFKTGRYSRYLPAKLDKLYEEALSRPDLVEMTEHIALLEGRIKLILSETSSGHPVPSWADLCEAFDEAQTAILCGDQKEIVPTLERVNKILEGGRQWDRAWTEILETMEQLRKMTDTEVKRKKELNQMVPVERVMILMAAVATAVKRNVKDPEQIQAVYRELAMLHEASDKMTTVGGNKVLHGPEVTPRAFIDTESEVA